MNCIMIEKQFQVEDTVVEVRATMFFFNRHRKIIVCKLYGSDQ